MAQILQLNLMTDFRPSLNEWTDFSTCTVLWPLFIITHMNLKLFYEYVSSMVHLHWSMILGNPAAM